MRDGWVETKLGLISDFVMGQAPLGERCNKDGVGTPFVKAGEFQENRPKIVEWTTDPLKLAKSSDVLVCVVGATAGKINLGADCAIGRSVAAVRPGEILDQFYLYYLLSLELSNLRSGSRGSAQGVITKDDLYRIHISLPPLAEQKRVVDLISSVDSYIEALQQQVDKARKSRNAVLHKLLTKGGDGWVETTIGNICDFINGDRGKNYPSAKFRQSHGIPFINAGHLDNGVVNFDEMDFISEEVFERLGGGKIQPGDTLFCLRGSVGKFANVGNLEKGAIASSLVIIRPNFRITKDFLMHYLDSELCASELKQSLTGAVQPNLSANNLKSFKIFLPNIKTQNEIGNILSHFNNLIILIDHLIASTKKLRSALLSDLLSGNHEIPTTYDKHIGAA